MTSFKASLYRVPTVGPKTSTASYRVLALNLILFNPLSNGILDSSANYQFYSGDTHLNLSSSVAACSHSPSTTFIYQQMSRDLSHLDSVLNLDVSVDENFTFGQQISSVSKSCFLNFRAIYDVNAIR